MCFLNTFAPVIKTKKLMKKILLFLAASAFLASCNRLAENEFEIAGKIDPSLNGKNVFLEKQGGYMGFAPIDTVKIEDGKFLFKGTVTDPSLHFIQVEGLQGKTELILENGEINVEVDKDSLHKSVTSGTFNNDMLKKYYDEMKPLRLKMVAFQKKNQDAMMEAYKANDTVVMNRLNKEYKLLGDEMQKKSEDFIKNNPKAYINVLLVKQMMGSGKPVEEVKAKFDSLDPEVKKTKEGQEVAKMFEDAQKEAESVANVEVGNRAPGFSAPSPEGTPISLKESMGKVTIIDFWASWCKPCRLENPNVVAMYNELHPQGLNIIGVSLDKDAAKWKEAIAADKLTWNHVSNLKFWDEPIAKQYGVKSIPATFILDASGKIVAKDLRGDALKAKVKELLAAK